MIIHNAYNILWLDINSTQKEITKRWKDILKYLAIWEVPFFDNDLDLVEEYRNDKNIKEAINNLSNPKKRLINSFFWFEIEDEEDKKIFNLINKKNFIWAISLVEKSKNKKNLAILYSLILLDKDLENIKINDTPIVLVEKLINIFKELWENKWFWKLFEKKFFLHDDLSTDKKILEDFKSNLWVYLSDLFHDISKNIWNDEVLKIFNKTFSNIKWNKTNKEVDIVYLKLTEIVKRLEWMDISEDWIFDDDEKAELKKTYREVNSLLKKFKDIWLYDDSKTILIRDNLVKALRIIMLDLSNNLSEDEEVLKVLKFALKIVWTDWLKHKIKEEYGIITENIELKPIIKLIDEWKNKAAYIRINKLEKLNNDEKKLQSLKNLKNQAVFWLLWDDFLKAKKLFEKWSYVEANNLFKKVELFAEENIYLFNIDEKVLNTTIINIKNYLEELSQWKYESKDVFDYIDGIRDWAVKNLWEVEWYFCIFYIDSISYWYISDINWNPKKTGKPAFLFTLNWVWVSIYWDTTYITILWVPIIPLSSRNVRSLWGSQYNFSWKKEMDLWKKIWKYIVVWFIIILILNN